MGTAVEQIEELLQDLDEIELEDVRQLIAKRQAELDAG